jgi:hypothetical protein
MALLLYQYETCKPLTRQQAINEYLAKPAMLDYKDTLEFKQWLKAEFQPEREKERKRKPTGKPALKKKNEKISK